MKRLCILLVVATFLTSAIPTFAMAEKEITTGISNVDEPTTKRIWTVPPIGLRVGYLPAKQLNYLYWKPVPGAVSYNVYWGTDPHVTKKSEYGGDTQGMTAFSHPGVENGGRYYYRVSSVMASGKESRLSKVVSTTVMDDFVVHFPDPTLEALIRGNIGKPAPDDIMYSDLQRLTAFVPTSEELYDLEGLQYCSHLSYIRSNFNQVSDVHPLAHLDRLDELIIGDCQISDISPLAGLVGLLELSLDGNQISDISPLAGLVHLQMLTLGRNEISDISILPNFADLVILGLKNNEISDISSISAMMDNDDRDEAGFSQLDLAGNQISDIAPLISNSILREFSMLDIEGNPLNAASCSVFVPVLLERGVDLKHSCPSEPDDFEVHFPDPNLEAEIRSAINKPEPDDILYSDLQELTKMSLAEKNINNIEGLQYCSNLQTLIINTNQIIDIRPLSGLVHLKTLDISNNQINDIKTLAVLVHLATLDISNNQISEIWPLSDLDNLAYLYLNDNQISNINPLSGLNNLHEVSLDNNQISDIRRLVDNSEIGQNDYVWLRNNPLNSTSCSEYIPQLLERGVVVYYDCP